MLAATPALADPTAYVRARAADAAGEARQAAEGYALALAAEPADDVIALRAYRKALAAGDYGLASRAAAVLVRAGTAPPDTALLALAIALKSKDLAGAQRAVDRLSSGPLDFLVPTLRAWLAYDRHENAVAVLDATTGAGLGRRFMSRHRMLLLLASGREREALLGVTIGLGIDEAPEDRIDAAALLARDSRERARAFLFGDAPELVRLRERPPTAKPGAAFGASRLFASLAGDIAGQPIDDLSIALTRAALLLDPEFDRARLLLAETLSREGSHQLALDTLQAIERDSPYQRRALATRVTVLRNAGRAGEAIALARSLADARGATLAEVRTYGDALADSGAQAQAADAYADAIQRVGDNWELQFARGKALDRAGRWPEARAALQRAVAAAPGEVAPLEYLGSAQLRHGEDPDAALALLEAAGKLKPDDPEISGSLAWGYFERGEFDRALPLLEAAARGDPGGTRINEHLGDAYWRLGRHYEARYAWQAAAIYADTQAVARIEGKLANGLKAQAN